MQSGRMTRISKGEFMSTGRKFVTVLSTVALAAGVMLAGSQAATADDAPAAGTALGEATILGTPVAGTASPIELRGNYRIANGKNTVNVNAVDKAGAPDVSIALRTLRLQRSVNGTFRNVAVNWDQDGWHGANDAASLTVFCVKGALYRATYSVEYRGGATGKGTVTTSSWRCPS